MKAIFIFGFSPTLGVEHVEVADAVHLEVLGDFQVLHDGISRIETAVVFVESGHLGNVRC